MCAAGGHSRPTDRLSGEGQSWAEPLSVSFSYVYSSRMYTTNKKNIQIKSEEYRDGIMKYFVYRDGRGLDMPVHWKIPICIFTFNSFDTRRIIAKVNILKLWERYGKKFIDV